MQRIVARLIADAALVGLCMFAAAGTMAWREAWILLAVMLTVRITGARAVYRVNPALLLDRSRLPIHSAQPWTDRALLLGVLGTGMLGVPLIASIDIFHWTAFPPTSQLVSGIGLVLFTLGWTLKSLALRANAYAVPVVRVQRHQVLADKGVYAVVRHPFYAADFFILPGAALWLGSWLAALAAIVPLALMVARLILEERFLRRELNDYRAYAARVRYRLVPGVW